VPGGSLLEVLLGAPLLSPFMGSLWADTNPLGSDELPGLSLRKKDRLSALGELRQDSFALDEVMGEMRSLMGIASADRTMTDLYVKTAQTRIGAVADTLWSSDSAALSSRAFLSDLWWVDELFTSLARGRGLGAPRFLAELPVEGDDPEGMSLLGYGGYGNMPPVAYDDSYYTKHDTTRSVSPPGVMSNDYDPNHDPLTASLVSGPSHAASFTFNSNGSFSYTPAYHYVGGDSFVYRVSDGQYTDDATASINVTNTPPVANADCYLTKHDTTLNVSAPGVKTNDYDYDYDPITAVLVSGPSHASSFTLNADGSFSYSPAYHYVGGDGFTYKVNDGIADSNTATVSISVYNNTPVANSDYYSTKHDVTLNVPAPGLKTNDYDGDSDPLEAMLVTVPSNALSFTFDSNGSFSYTPQDHYVGTDSFTYKVSDGIADSNTTTAWINVWDITPTVEIVPIDTVANELNPNELLEDNLAQFLITRTECRDHDLPVYLDFGGSADREDYQLSVDGEVVDDVVLMPEGEESVQVTLTALHDDMTSDVDEIAIVAIAPAPDGSYLPGQRYSQTFSLVDTSTWKQVATNPQLKPFPNFAHSHPSPPPAGESLTVVIVMGGARDSFLGLGEGSERNAWRTQAITAFPGAWIYNDVKNATEFADVVAAFPAGSVSQLVVGGHGTWTERVGVQPTNNNTEVPSGYDFVDSFTIPALLPARRDAIRAALAPDAMVVFHACGGAKTEPRVQAGKDLASFFSRNIRYAVGSVNNWNMGTPGDEKYDGIPTKGEWVVQPPAP